MLRFLRSISERQIAVASSVPAVADESVRVACQPESLGEREGPPTRRFATTPADSLREKGERRLVSRLGIEPRTRRLRVCCSAN